MEKITATEAILRMNEPTEFLKGMIFSCQINFYAPDNPDYEDEVSFDINCTKRGWRNELLNLWEDFRKENNLPENCVSDAWLTIPNPPEEESEI